MDMFWYMNRNNPPQPKSNPMKDKMTEDLLKCEEHFDVTMKCEDGEIKSSKFFLSARSEYFSTMFKENQFKESSGVVKFDCKKIIMEKIIHYLYGQNLVVDGLSLEERLELFNLMRMMLLDKTVDNLEGKLFLALVKKTRIDDYDTFPTAVEILDATLKLNLNVSKDIANYMGEYFHNILHFLEDDSADITLSKPVLIALASSTAHEMDKLKLHNYLRKTNFPMDEFPKLELMRFNVEDLERVILTSGLFEENEVLRTIIQKQKQILRNCSCCEHADSDY